jgi:hypothetical protein
MKQFTFIETPSHGYLVVKLTDIDGLFFSQYSPSRKGNIYLEEDIDAPRFLQILRDRGEEFQIKTEYSEYFDPFYA